MENFIQLLVQGILVGMSYAVLAAGLTLIFGVMNIINFTHSDDFCHEPASFSNSATDRYAHRITVQIGEIIKSIAASGISVIVTVTK